MKLIDKKNRSIELGQRVRIEEDIPSVDGMLYKHQLVKVDEWDEINNKIRVIDSTGKVWWIEPSNVSMSFL
jgi:hypothetical protein